MILVQPLQVVCVAGVLSEEKKSVKKLQIGVKKRVENCSIKSRKGDLLHMHYTVKRTPTNRHCSLAFWFLPSKRRCERFSVFAFK